MAYTVPTIADFKAQFSRDFPYGTTPDTVMDADITAALTEAGINFNEGLWSTQAQFSLAYLLYSAHLMVLALRSSAQGVAGKYAWLQASKSVGSVSESFAIPQKILDNPIFAMLAQTNYGARYLQMALPRLVGQAFTVCGRTQP